MPQVPVEPTPTALALSILGLLLALAVLFSRTIGRHGVPVVLLFLGLGMVAGSEGLGGIAFEDYTLAFQVGTVALVAILFDGGLNTPISVVRRTWAPAGILATLGVALTAGGVALAGRLLGLGWMESMLLGAVVSSTDAAAVFSVLRGSGVRLRQRVAAAIELESGLNDPMAVILTFGITSALVRGEELSARLLLDILVQLVVGAVCGIGFGHAGRWILHFRLLSGGLYPVLMMAIGSLAFGVTTLAQGSGFLAVYVAGIVLGNGALPHRATLLRSLDFVAWLAQVLMFLMLGLLAFPSRLLEAMVPGLVIAGALAFLARPLAVWLCLLPFRFQPREVGYIGWVGLRGAVPIILATYPMMAGIEQGSRIFDIVFFVVVVSALVQGWSVPLATRWFGLERQALPPSPSTIIEVSSALPLEVEISTHHVGPASPVAGRQLRELQFPEGASAIMVVRDGQLIAPKGRTELLPGDHVSVFCRPEDRDRMLELFAGPPRE